MSAGKGIVGDAALLTSEQEHTVALRSAEESRRNRSRPPGERGGHGGDRRGQQQAHVLLQK